MAGPADHVRIMLHAEPSRGQAGGSVVLAEAILAGSAAARTRACLGHRRAMGRAVVSTAAAVSTEAVVMLAARTVVVTAEDNQLRAKRGREYSFTPLRVNARSGDLHIIWFGVARLTPQSERKLLLNSWQNRHIPQSIIQRIWAPSPQMRRPWFCYSSCGAGRRTRSIPCA